MASRKGAATAGATASKGVPASGPLAQIFGVRHLSPMGAWHLRKFLEDVQPTAVLVEGPSDATENIVHLVHKDTKPPVAILAFTKQRPVRSILFPLAQYSPEWVALTWALKNKRVAKFMDLPAETFLALEKKQDFEEAKQDAKTGPGGEKGKDGVGGKDPVSGDETLPTGPIEMSDTERYLADPYEAIATLSGDPDHETWWEKHFEHSTEEDAYRASIYEFGLGLRQIEYEGARGREETLLREAFMRRTIRQTIEEGHDPDKIVVVCGAFHASVLVGEIPAMTDDERKKLPRADTTQTLMPYSYLRLSSQSGYGAGNHAPMYFQELWEELQAGSTARLSPRFLAELAGGLRKKGTVRSSAEVIEAVRLANTMAALSGDTSSPTLRDLRDAAITLLGQGDKTVIEKIFEETTIGHAIGKVPKGVLQTALQDDFRMWVKDLKLEDYLKEKDQLVKGSTSKEWLDLRRDRFSKAKDGEFRDLQRSIFFHRLAVLEIGFATEKTTARDRDESTYKEVWSARWTPECEMHLAENALRGDTVELATLRAVQEKISQVGEVQEAAVLVRQAVECDLVDAVTSARQKAQSLAVDDGNFPGIAGACVDLANLIRLKEDERVKRLVAAGHDKPIAQLVNQLFLKGVLMTPGASRCSKDAQGQTGRALANLQTVANYGDADFPGIDAERWRRVLDQMADDELTNAHVAGVACALLLERGEITDDVLDRRVAKRLSPGTDPEDGASFFEGLATRNRYALLSRKKLWHNMTMFIEALDDDAFRRAVVALRRAFGAFEAGEARRIADILAELWGGGAREIHAAIETKLDGAELAAAQAQKDQENEALADELGDLDLGI